MGGKAVRQGSEACEAEIPNPNKKANQKLPNCRLTGVPCRLARMARMLCYLTLCNDPSGFQNMSQLEIFLSNKLVAKSHPL